MIDPNIHTPYTNYSYEKFKKTLDEDSKKLMHFVRTYSSLIPGNATSYFCSNVKHVTKKSKVFFK